MKATREDLDFFTRINQLMSSDKDGGDVGPTDTLRMVQAIDREMAGVKAYCEALPPAPHRDRDGLDSRWFPIIGLAAWVFPFIFWAVAIGFRPWRWF